MIMVMSMIITRIMILIRNMIILESLIINMVMMLYISHFFPEKLPPPRPPTQGLPPLDARDLLTPILDPSNVFKKYLNTIF